MTLLFIDSCDTYASASAEIGQKWGIQSAVVAATGGGRTGGGYASVPNNRAAATLGRILPAAKSTIIVGFAHYQDTMSTDDGFFCTFCDGTSEQIGLYLNNDRTIGIYRGASLLATTTYTLPVTTYTFMEMKVVFHASSGSIELRADGTPIYTASGISTIATANPSADRWYLVGRPSSNGTSVFSIGNSRFDDVYICDSLGALNNNFLGSVAIHALWPTGNGNSSQFAGSDGNSVDNYLLVDDVATAANDEDATYVSSANVGDIDLYAYRDIPTTPDAILGIQHFIRARTDGAAIAVTPMVRRGGVNYSGASKTVSGSYGDYLDIAEVDPSTSVSWTKTNIDGAEFGIKVS